MAITLESFNELCRFCLSVGSHKPLFGVSIEQMAYDIFAIKMEPNDGYPQQACRWCINKLSAAYTFQKMVLKNHDTLTALKNSKLRNENKDKLLDETGIKNEQCETEIDETNIDELRAVNLRDIQSIPTLINPSLPVINYIHSENNLECDELKLDSKSFSNDLERAQNNLKEVCAISDKAINWSGKGRHTLKPLQCNACGRSFANRSNLYRHRMIHEGRRNLYGPHLCSYCGKKFKWKTSLYKHVRLHTGKFLHECSVCAMKFTEATTLSTHMRSHSSKNAMKPLACDECGATFNQRSNLKRHLLRMHSTNRKKHLCADCNKGYVNAYSLQMHRLSKHYTAQEILKCDECGREFLHAKLLRTHLNCHRRNAKKDLSKSDENCKETKIEFQYLQSTEKSKNQESNSITIQSVIAFDVGEKAAAV